MQWITMEWLHHLKIIMQARSKDFFSLSYDSLAVSARYQNSEIGFVSSSSGQSVWFLLC
ncbi:hypothetical protein TanjilG_28274 [Lupinus angustifolius]|uniref:Uncharacterized protein n=1 Tax=Lupinus angustifolius TaxID=3871 RepID=A0A394DGM9_LUPAN|nr:hypothetical protein TanjilG_28274 [Lupinus angustifolius]